MTLTCNTFDGVHERHQLPFKLASWAMTIHMSEGVTLKRACIDIGKCRQLSFLMLITRDQPLAEVDDPHPETASKTGKIRGVQQGTNNMTCIIIV